VGGVGIRPANWSAARSVLDELRAVGLFPATLSQPEREPELALALERRLLASEEPLTAEEILARQREFLAELLTEAAEQTAYYRHSLPPSSRRGCAIEEIPFLTRDTLRSCGESLISRRFEGARISRKITSGTSGMPVMIVQSEDEAYSTLHYDLARVARLAGFPALERWESPYVLAVTDNPNHKPFGTYNPLIDKWCRFEVIDPLVPADVRVVLDLLEQLEPAVLVSRPSALRLLLDLAVTRGRQPAAMPLGVVSSGDSLHCDDLARLAAIFNARVSDLYAISECSGVASLCRESRRYHVHWEIALVEVVDPDTGMPRQDEEPGEIVVTDLRRRAMPIIRYRTGDFGRRALTPCPCGRPGPTLLSIDGREGCYFRLADGRLLNPSRLNQPLSRLPGVKQFRLTQTGLRRVVMEVVVDGGDRAALERRAREILAAEIPTPMKLRFEVVKRLGEAGAKVARYVSRVAAAPERAQAERVETSAPLPVQEVRASLDRCGLLSASYRGIGRIEDLSSGLGRSRVFRVVLAPERGSGGRCGTVILKILELARESLVDPRDPLLARREVLVAESGIGGRLPAGLAMPPVLAIDPRSRDEQPWIWMGDLAPYLALSWTSRRALQAAQRCALFYELYRREPELRDLSWLGREGYAAYAHHVEPAHRNLEALTGDERWRDLLPPAAIPKLHRSLDLLPRAVERLRSLPPTFIHGDFHIRNLGLYPDGTLLALDWASFGIAPLGCDLATFVSVFRLFGGQEEDLEQLEHSLFEAYLAEVERIAGRGGLREPISQAVRLWHMTWGLHLRLGPGLTALLEGYIQDDEERTRAAADVREGCLRALEGLEVLGDTAA
jgi:phenylacetate-coenzyme A ligase PaaK-like adenylate-forming protein